jgi:hypothetical protein
MKNRMYLAEVPMIKVLVVIHMRRLVCMFDIAIQIRCSKMYAVQSLERSSKEEHQHASPGEDDEEPDVNEAVLVERVKQAVVSTLPKNLIAYTPVQVYFCGRRF